MPNIKRKTIKETDSFKARLEEYKDEGNTILFVHIELKTTVTKRLIEEIRKEFDEYKRLIKSAGYTVIHTYSATPKFYRMFKGWEEIGEMQGEFEGYKVVKWDLN